MKVLIGLMALGLSLNIYATISLIRWTPVISAYSIMTFEGTRCSDEIRMKNFSGIHCDNYENDRDVYEEIRKQIPPNHLFKLFIPDPYWKLK